MGSRRKVREETRKLKILILDQGRQSLPFLKSFHQSGHETICICNTRLSECFFSRYPSKRLIWPSYVKDRQAFERKLINYISEHKIDVTISVGDISSDILSRNREIISRHTHLTVPDYSTFIKASDKWKLMDYCMANNLPCPKTYRLNDEFLLGNQDFLKFPVIVKPTRGIGAIGVVRFDKIEDLEKQYVSLQTRYGELIIQEYIPQEGGMQYQAEAFSDETGKVKVCMVIKKPRFFPVSGGTSTANVTIQHNEIENTTRILLDGLGWRGAADVDYILDPRDNVVKILEINPRVTAGIKIGFAAGIDYADLHLKLALGEMIPEINTYKLGIYCRNFFLDVLWFLYSDSRMKKNTQPSFFKFFGRDVFDQVISIDDPLAGLGFFLNMIRKYSSISHLKSKFHK
ncbi:MAG: ATP-grasp domain-containing protein [Bacteroidales bacterium]|nr:ATP-grasp domain-containing protein [Bacteroidales bacterium]